MFGPEKFKKNIDFMESTPKSRSVGIAHFFKHISIAIWLKSLEYQFRGRDIYPFLEKSTWNQPIPQSLRGSTSPIRRNVTCFTLTWCNFLPRYSQNSNNWIRYSLWNNLIFSELECECSFSMTYTAFWRHGVYVLAFSHTVSWFFPNGTLNYVSIRK